MRSSTLASATSPEARPWPRRTLLARLILREPAAALAAVVLLALIGMAVFASVLTPYRFDQQHLESTLQPPGPKFWLGSDNYGRDLLTRVAHGARISLVVAVIVVTAEAFVGALWGMIAGLAGGRIDASMMRVVDMLMAFPLLLLAILITGIFGPSLVNVVVALVVAAWPGMARLVRSEVIGLRELEFVEAARALGGSEGYIVRRHIARNIAHLVVTRGALDASVVIIIEATLSFVGVGVQPPQPSWGLMISEAFPYLRSAPHLMLFPAAFLSVTVVALNVVGEALLNTLDPRRRQR